VAAAARFKSCHKLAGMMRGLGLLPHIDYDTAAIGDPWKYGNLLAWEDAQHRRRGGIRRPGEIDPSAVTMLDDEYDDFEPGLYTAAEAVVNLDRAYAAANSRRAELDAEQREKVGLGRNARVRSI
jgi:hypothetical protein